MGLQLKPGETDTTLVRRAARGDTSAFEELYRRHADAAWRVARSTARGPHDAADAVSEAFTKVFENLRRGDGAHVENFRSYLVAATRNAAVDRHRRGSRERPDESVAPGDTAAPSSDVVIDLTDASLVGEAFDDLPDRWREVLWLTEVEEMEPAVAAEKLGVKRGALAQLAFRARAGLRERYVRAHLPQVEGPCRPVVENLAAYVLGELPPGKRARLEDHLAECVPCEQRREEIENLGETLRRAVLPLPVGLAALTTRRFSEQIGANAARGLADVARGLTENPVARAAVGATAAGLAISGLLTLGQIDEAEGLTRDPVGSGPPSTAVDTSGGSVGRASTAGEVVLGSPGRSPLAAAGSPRVGGTAGVEPAPGSLAGDQAPGGEVPADDPGGEPTPEPEPLAQVVVVATDGETKAVVAAGAGDNACNGAAVGGQGSGCTEPAGDATVIRIDPTALP